MLSSGQAKLTPHMIVEKGGCFFTPRQMLMFGSRQDHRVKVGFFKCNFKCVELLIDPKFGCGLGQNRRWDG